MEIHNDNLTFWCFTAPYAGKELLKRSIKNTEEGYQAISNNSILSGCRRILLGRIQSIAAFAFVAISSTFLSPGLLLSSCLLTPIIALNVLSRIPGISSFESVQHFTHQTSDIIHRSLRIYLLALPVIFLFLSASTINAALPGILKPENIFFGAIHSLVEPLGPIETINAIALNGELSVLGTEKETSVITCGEEYLRALSPQNILKVMIDPNINYYEKSAMIIIF